MAQNGGSSAVSIGVVSVPCLAARMENLRGSKCLITKHEPKSLRCPRRACPERTTAWLQDTSLRHTEGNWPSAFTCRGKTTQPPQSHHTPLQRSESPPKLRQITLKSPTTTTGLMPQSPNHTKQHSTRRSLPQTLAIVLHRTRKNHHRATLLHRQSAMRRAACRTLDPLPLVGRKQPALGPGCRVRRRRFTNPKRARR